MPLYILASGKPQQEKIKRYIVRSDFGIDPLTSQYEHTSSMASDEPRNMKHSDDTHITIQQSEETLGKVDCAETVPMLPGILY